MPNGRYGDGVTLLRFLQRRFPNLKLVVLTGMESPLVLRSIQAAGVTCIVSKSDSLEHVVPAVHAARSGQPFVSPAIERLLAHVAEAPGSGASAPSLETEVLRMFAEGLTIREIAERVGAAARPSARRKWRPCASLAWSGTRTCSSTRWRMGWSRHRRAPVQAPVENRTDSGIVRWSCAAAFVFSVGHTPVTGDHVPDPNFLVTLLLLRFSEFRPARRRASWTASISTCLPRRSCAERCAANGRTAAVTAKRAKLRARHGACKAERFSTRFLTSAITHGRCNASWWHLPGRAAHARSASGRPETPRPLLLGRVRFDSRVALTNLASVR